MGIMTDLADEAIKPVKTAVYIGSAVLVAGGGIMLANSKRGRKFFGNVKNAIKGDDKDVNKSTDGKSPKEIEKKKVDTPEMKEQPKGSDNV